MRPRRSKKRLDTAVSYFTNTNCWSLSLDNLFLVCQIHYFLPDIPASLMHCVYLKSQNQRPRRYSFKTETTSLLIIHLYKVAYGLSIGTKISDLEWPWTAQWPQTRAIRALTVSIRPRLWCIAAYSTCARKLYAMDRKAWQSARSNWKRIKEIQRQTSDCSRLSLLCLCTMYIILMSDIFFRFSFYRATA